MKKIITTLVAGSVLLSFAACSTTPDSGENNRSTEKTVATSVLTEETTFETEGSAASGIIKSSNPVSNELRLYPVYQSVKLLTPGATIYTFDPGYFDDVMYKMGLADINGNLIYSDFSYVDYYKENNSYVVVNLGEFGITECGLVSAEGTKSTSMDYNGYYIDYDGTSYLTKYEKGTMIISCFDKDLNVVFENKEIKVNSNVASAMYGHRGICVRGSFENTTVVGTMDTNHDIYNCLIDNETGKVISAVDRVYGDLLVSSVQTGLEIYGQDGSKIEEFAKYKRYVLFPKEGLILYNDYQAVAVDLEGNIINSIDLKDGYYIDSTDNFIVMNNDNETNIYDKQLNFVMKCTDIRLRSGLVFELVSGDPTSIMHASFEGGFFVNVVSGNKVTADVYESDFRIIDELGLLYLHGDETICGFYDVEMNKVDRPFDYGFVVTDSVTGDVYISTYDSDNDISTVYNATTGEIYCELDGSLNDHYQVYDGVLSGITVNRPYSVGSFNEKHSILVGNDGEIIFSFEVENG
ncbi:MAG: hypothetical protein K6G47_07920 [Clostridia bacterium]|nr:hypothetical protein [Clostridia bacterium]